MKLRETGPRLRAEPLFTLSAFKGQETMSDFVSYLRVRPHQPGRFVLFCPPSPRQQVPSINTPLSVTGVTIGSCRCGEEGQPSECGSPLLKRYQLPICNRAHTHVWLYMHRSRKTHTHASTHSPYTLFALSSHLIIADAGKFVLVATRSDQTRKQRTTF